MDYGEKNFLTMYIEDITQVGSSYEIYQTSTIVILWLSYDLSKGLLIAFKVDIILTRNALLSQTSP